MSDEGCFREWVTKPQRLYRDGKIVMEDRHSWLPPADRQIGIGYDDDGGQRVVFFMRDGKFQMISKDIVSFLTVPAERVFDTKQEELYFCLFNRRTWYIYIEDGVCYAKYSK